MIKPNISKIIENLKAKQDLSDEDIELIALMVWMKINDIEYTGDL